MDNSGIRRYLTSLRYIIWSHLMPRYFSDTDIRHITSEVEENCINHRIKQDCGRCVVLDNEMRFNAQEGSRYRGIC